MIKLLYVDHVTKVLGGSEQNLLQLLERIDRRRFAPSVACVSSGALDQELNHLGIDRKHFTISPILSEFRIAGRRLSMFRAFGSAAVLQNVKSQIVNIAKQEKARALISITNKDHFASGMAASSLNLPSIWWINDALTADLFSPIVLKAFSLMARLYSTKLVAVSDYVRNSLLKLGILEKNTVTIYNAVDHRVYKRTDAGAIRAELGIPADNSVISIVGRITPGKGQHIFIDIAKQIARQHSSVYFLIVGEASAEDQEYADKLRKEIADSGFENRIRFLDFQKNLNEIYSASNILLNCSTKPESFGRVLIEAMSCELPVIAASAGGVEEIVESNRNGFLIKPGDVGSYINRLKILLDDPERAIAMGKEGREMIIERFSLNRMVYKFESMLGETIANYDLLYRT